MTEGRRRRWENAGRQGLGAQASWNARTRRPAGVNVRRRHSQGLCESHGTGTLRATSSDSDRCRRMRDEVVVGVGRDGVCQRGTAKSGQQWPRKA